MSEQITYRLDVFDGPLDLLLELIKKNKVSITDIPIALICDQYMEYIEAAQKMDLEVAAEFIVMASDLMLIKSKMILPHEEGTENDPRREIQNALLLYQQAKEAAKNMQPLYDEFSQRYIKDTDEVPPERGLPMNLDTELLMKALNSVMKRMKIANEEKNPNELVNPLIKRKVVSVEEKINEICDYLDERGESSLYDLLVLADSRPELIARFMGVLELIKLGRIKITTVKYVEDIIEYEERGLEMRFILNPDYVPPEDGEESEFDSNPDDKKEEDSTNE